MEKNTSQNQNNNKDNSNKDQHKKGEDSMLKILQPHDMSKTVESAMHVFQGHHEKLPELMHDVGNIILKATKRLSTAQLILAAGALTIGAVLLARYSEGDEESNYQEA